MIVPMKKVSLVVLKSEQKEALEKLRAAGVLHPDHLEGRGEKFSELKSSLEKAQAAVLILSEIKSAAVKKSSMKHPELSAAEISALCAKVTEGAERKKILLDSIVSNTTELERFTEWGNVDPADFAYLEKKGIFLSLYEIPQDKWHLIGNDVKVIMVNRGKSQIHFLMLSDSPDTARPSGLPPEAYAVPLPRCSTLKLAEDIEAARREIQKIDYEKNQQVAYIPDIHTYCNSVLNDIEFETLYTGMDKEDGNNSTALCWITGFVPADFLDKIRMVAHEQHWAIAISDPSDNDEVPTKLKNNRLVSLIYPLTDFLGTVPGYHEYDISGWFLLFFTVFFGMIFGDGGYGLLITAGAVAGILLASTKRQPVAAGLKLVLLLGLATVVWGTVTCTWFGLSMEQIPQWLKDISIRPLSSAFSAEYVGKEGVTTVSQNLQMFCFSLALLQLTIAHLHGIRRYIHSLRCLGDFGSMFMLWGMFYVVLSMVVSSKIFSFDKIVYGIPIGTVSVFFVGAGFVLNFVFSNYDGSIGESILTSLKGIISVLLGVVNVFSDIVSYIRLWAVGLAGAAISGTVNTMAGPLLGKAALFLAFIILIVFGHGLNMILNVLSVIVHGVRLNTLEFSTHLGMSWSGFKYEPFSETVNK